MPVKYGIMAYEGIAFFPNPGFRFDFGDKARLIIEPVEKTLDGSDSRHWAEWIGSISWNEFSKGNVQIQVWRETNTPTVVDQENEDLSNTLWRYSKALMLCGLLRSPSSRPRFITGQAEIINGTLTPADIRTTGKGPSWITPQYIFLDAYTKSKLWDDVAHHAPWHYKMSLFEDWKLIAEQLTPVELEFKRHYLLNLSLYAFQQALAEPNLEFAFPNLVRSIETLVALSAGQGRGFFARRAKRFLPRNDELMFPLDEDRVITILKESYGLRSDCVHGKPFGWSLGSKREEFLKEDAAICSYLIETLARHTIRAAIADPSFISVIRDRASLETYWNNLDPSPPTTLCPNCKNPQRTGS